MNLNGLPPRVPPQQLQPTQSNSEAADLVLQELLKLRESMSALTKDNIELRKAVIDIKSRENIPPSVANSAPSSFVSHNDPPQVVRSAPTFVAPSPTTTIDSIATSSIHQTPFTPMIK